MYNLTFNFWLKLLRLLFEEYRNTENCTLRELLEAEKIEDDRLISFLNFHIYMEGYYRGELDKFDYAVSSLRGFAAEIKSLHKFEEYSGRASIFFVVLTQLSKKKLYVIGIDIVTEEIETYPILLINGYMNSGRNFALADKNDRVMIDNREEIVTPSGSRIEELVMKIKPNFDWYPLITTGMHKQLNNIPLSVRRDQFGNRDLYRFFEIQLLKKYIFCDEHNSLDDKTIKLNLHYLSLTAAQYNQAALIVYSKTNQTLSVYKYERLKQKFGRELFAANESEFYDRSLTKQSKAKLIELLIKKGMFLVDVSKLLLAHNLPSLSFKRKSLELKSDNMLPELASSTISLPKVDITFAEEVYQFLVRHDQILRNSAFKKIAYIYNLEDKYYLCMMNIIYRKAKDRISHNIYIISEDPVTQNVTINNFLNPPKSFHNFSDFIHYLMCDPTTFFVDRKIFDLITTKVTIPKVDFPTKPRLSQQRDSLTDKVISFRKTIDDIIISACKHNTYFIFKYIDEILSIFHGLSEKQFVNFRLLLDFQKIAFLHHRKSPTNLFSLTIVNLETRSFLEQPIYISSSGELGLINGSTFANHENLALYLQLYYSIRLLPAEFFAQISHLPSADLHYPRFRKTEAAYSFK